MNKIILAAETGSDITPEIAARYHVAVVPMHVTMGEETRDDGSFPSEECCTWFDRSGQLPKTSGCSPEDFRKVFDRVHAQEPEAGILYLAYSACTTVSFSSAHIAAEGRDYVKLVDTKQVSGGQLMTVMLTARMLEAHPETTLDEAAGFAEKTAASVQMCFVPADLKYLRAGGRCSNAVYISGKLLQIHPCIEVLDGKLLATKRLRGNFKRLIPDFVKEYITFNHMEKEPLFLLWTPGFSDENKALVEQAARDCGHPDFTWIKTGCVITTHGGPGAFGIVGIRGKQ
ncbi:MAG: DegV family EDD domain-containing protein [Lachnospiraceae bacterium]|jgi:DegV family protein with EDD domain|nr:DegV family EDD domain-containing protein [Lachnospiraceae bacterium]